MFIVEGNIGAGKSTFLDIISKNIPEVDTSYEPVNSWLKPIDGQSILENFITNPTRWAFTMETVAMLQRVKDHIKEQKRNISLTAVERSVYSGHYCFSYNGYNSGYFTELEWQMYNQWFDFLIPNNCQPPLGFIYLRVSPEVAYSRISKRNRPEEKTIPLEYIKNIHDLHERFLIKKENILKNLIDVPVLVLDCNQNFEKDEKYKAEIINKAKEFMIQNIK